MLRKPKTTGEIIGDVFLINLYGQLEDARELSAKINACSRSGKYNLAIQFCMEVPSMKKKVESIYLKYKQELITGIKFVKESEKIIGEGFVIINVQEKVKDTMIGTITSILAYSGEYPIKTIITSMAHYEEGIKISSRNVGGEGRNVREVLNSIVKMIGGEVGGHEFAAGCTIKKEKENEFIELLKKELSLEMIKVIN